MYICIELVDFFGLIFICTCKRLHVLKFRNIYMYVEDTSRPALIFSRLFKLCSIFRWPFPTIVWFVMCDPQPLKVCAFFFCRYCHWPACCGYRGSSLGSQVVIRVLGSAGGSGHSDQHHVLTVSAAQSLSAWNFTIGRLLSRHRSLSVDASNKLFRGRHVGDKSQRSIWLCVEGACR